MKKFAVPSFLMSSLAVVAALAMTTSSASAQIVYLLNWESAGTTPTFDFTGGDASSALSTVANGPGGSLARNITFDTTGAPFSVSYTSGFNTKANTPTSSNASDYILSFQVRADGLATPDGLGQFMVVFNDATFTANITVTSTFQPISIALSDMTLSGGTFEVTDFDSGNQQWKINQLGISGVNRYGEKAGNVLIFDDIAVTQVPEPTSLALLGLTGVALLGFRRRRAA